MNIRLDLKRQKAKEPSPCLLYIRAHLEQVQRAITDGVAVRGYMYWSLTDNFEWQHGYGMRFGLIDVDFHTQKRTVKESGSWFAELIEK